MTQEGNQTQKADAGKRKWHLWTWKASEWILRVMEYGAARYSPFGWKTVDDAKVRYGNALVRHAVKYLKGEYWDLCDSHGPDRPDDCQSCTGLPHLAQVGCNACFLLEEIDPPEAHQKKASKESTQSQCDWVFNEPKGYRTCLKPAGHTLPHDFSGPLK